MKATVGQEGKGCPSALISRRDGRRGSRSRRSRHRAWRAAEPPVRFPHPTRRGRRSDSPPTCEGRFPLRRAPRNCLYRRPGRARRGTACGRTAVLVGIAVPSLRLGAPLLCAVPLALTVIPPGLITGTTGPSRTNAIRQCFAGDMRWARHTCAAGRHHPGRMFTFVREAKDSRERSHQGNR